MCADASPRLRVGDLDLPALDRRLASAGLDLNFGTARARVRARVPGLAEVLRRIYWRYPLMGLPFLPHATVTLARVGGWRRLWRPQVEFVIDGTRPFEPFPADTHLPLLEWGLNYAFAERLNQHLLLHAGAVSDTAGNAVLLPGVPGAGKSTLAASLMFAGYRLLSDEFGVVGLQDGLLRPLLRPIGLKNESIDVIRGSHPEAVLGPAFPKTRKGTIAHLAPDAASLAALHRPAKPALVVFPAFARGALLEFEELPASEGMARLGIHAFNYRLLGPAGFDALVRLATGVRFFAMRYGDLDDAVAVVARLLPDSTGSMGSMGSTGRTAPGHAVVDLGAA